VRTKADDPSSRRTLYRHMDQELIINAIEQHVTALQDIFAWALIIALGVGWAGLQNNKELEIVGIKFNRRSAFYVAAFLYVVANIAVLLLLWRI